MSVICIVLPLALLVVIVAVIVFIGAVRRGQFDDLDTPSVRMLQDDDRSIGRQDAENAPESGRDDEPIRPAD